MKAYCIDHFGGVDGVVLRSRDDPRPGRREILVRVRATSLNYRDLMVLKGGGRGPVFGPPWQQGSPAKDRSSCGAKLSNTVGAI